MKGLILLYLFSVILLFINSESETYVILEYIIRLNNHLVEYLLKHLYLHIKSSCCCFFNLLSSCPFFYPHAFFSSIHMPSSLLSTCLLLFSSIHMPSSLLFYPHAFLSSIHMPSSLLSTCLPLFYPHAFFFFYSHAFIFFFFFYSHAFFFFFFFFFLRLFFPLIFC